MSRQIWQELVSWAGADGTAVASTAAETIIFPDVTLPGNYLQDGRKIRLRCCGKLSTTGAPTMIFRLRLGGVAGVLLANTETLTMGTGVTDLLWELQATIQTRTNGSTGTVLAIGRVTVMTSTTAQTTTLFGVSGADAPAPSAAIDLTADKALSVTAQWGTSSASNTLTGMEYGLESLN